jgi:hypothetical protein
VISDIQIADTHPAAQRSAKSLPVFARAGFAMEALLSARTVIICGRPWMDSLLNLNGTDHRRSANLALIISREHFIHCTSPEEEQYLSGGRFQHVAISEQKASCPHHDGLSQRDFASAPLRPPAEDVTISPEL